jgi:dolichyl-phosphooligosaccharide-protein glycotransferase
MLLLAIQFQRIVIYFTVNVVLLSALCIAEPIRWREDTLIGYLSTLFSRFFPGSESPMATNQDHSGHTAPKNAQDPRQDKKVHADASGKSRFPVKNKKTAPKRPVKNPVHFTGLLKDCILIIVVILTVVFFFVSFSQDISYGLSTPQHQLSPDWVESLEWLQANTPQTGVDYFKQYEARGFSYSPQAYGIMAIWDAGHWITFIAHRIPITNPFQNNLNGPTGTAAFFITGNESIADDILAKYGGRYVITDSSMAVDRFTNLVPWVSGSTDISSYVKWFMMPDRNNPQQLQKIHLYDNAYFQTMVARLHNFDGSMTRPTTGEYVQYNIRYVPAPGEIAGDVHGYARVIASEQEQDISHITNGTVLVKEGKDTMTGRFADFFSDLPNRTLQEIPALKHYRLIHESPDNASVQIFPESGITTLPDIKYVKIFEYVKGAHIPGEGIIEVPIVTNTGRTFVYRQASENGEFIVPYSTTGSHYDVKATGQYHIAGTSRYISVTEDDVLNENRVSGYQFQ